MGTSPAVFIFPEDIELTSGPTSFHRQFLDLYISQYNHKYLDDLIAYRKVILQRNKLLKSGSSEEISAFAAANPEKAKEIGRNGRKKAEKEFDERVIFSKIKTEYQNLIKKKLK